LPAVKADGVTVAYYIPNIKILVRL
jgi:hypothetical protein